MVGCEVHGIDLFCGAGGLSFGLQKAGISVIAGIDLDPASKFAFCYNNGCAFLNSDIRRISCKDLARLYPKNAVRLLAGCAPCRPFSPHRRGSTDPKHDEWSLLKEFTRLSAQLRPELITMENVPRLGSKPIFKEFVHDLEQLGYCVDWRSVHCAEYGIPQNRRRLVLLASRIGPISVPAGPLARQEFKTVRDAIGQLPRVRAGTTDLRDRLHRARSLSELNLQRLRASNPGGTWHDWPEELRSKCHMKKSGATYKNVYSRMRWDEPAPTITTLFHNFGTGRFGHPEQDRAITLREAALLQTFPRHFRFVDPKQKVYLTVVGRLIGNAVPPKLAFYIGKEIMRTARAAM
jgi:DNA (cytosine-5)-methyltransferase 1